MKFGYLVTWVLSVVFGIVIFMFPLIPISFIFLGIVFPILSSTVGESPFLSIKYIISSLTSCYVVTPFFLKEKYIPTIADTVLFPDGLVTAMFIALVLCGIPYFLVSLALVVVKKR